MLLNGLYFLFVPVYRVATCLYCRNGLQMGLFVRLWVISAIFNAFCPLWVAYWFTICDISMFAGCRLLFCPLWVQMLMGDVPHYENAKSGLPFQKIFFEILFFYFCICNRGLHEPVGVVSSFAGFFRVKGQKSSIFLML